jgi:beta-galactosidase
MARSSSDISTRPLRRKRPRGATIKKQVEAALKALDDRPRGRLTLSLNHDWRFLRIDGQEKSVTPPAAEQTAKWEQVYLPHSVRLEPPNASGGRNFQGICWYTRRLELNPDWKSKCLYLHFEGAMQVAELWVNGVKIATNHCGYLPFVIDLTRIARFGPEANELAVRLDNRDDATIPPGKKQKELDFCYFGGIYRNVRLEVIDRLHIADTILADKIAGGGVFVTFSNITPKSATVNVRTDLVNEHLEPRTCRIAQELCDASGRIVANSYVTRLIPIAGDATVLQSLEVPNPQLWHPNHPHLYTLRTTILGDDQPADETTTRIGIRHLHFDREQGLHINGKKFFSIGANRHQDHPYVGYALPDSAHYRDVKKLREAGFTSVRSHYPQSRAFMDACDELGMLAIVSNPGWQFVGDHLFQQRAIHNARLMVRRDRNHPSVILWEAALNESDNRPLYTPLYRAVHEEYPGDQCFTAGDHDLGTDGWDVDYLRNNGSKPGWIREWGDHVDNWSDQQSRSRVPRGWGENPMLIQARSHAMRLDEIAAGRCIHAKGIGTSRLGGACLWAGIDCQRGYHHQPFHGGALDLFRLPKFNYHFFQSQRDPAIHVPGLDDGPMVFIANYATFLSPTSVTVFSNCEEVRLSVDRKEIARKKCDPGWSIAHPPFTFEVDCFAREQSTMYMTGVVMIEEPPVEILAEGFIGGKVAARHRIRPPGVARSISLEADFCGRPLVADGSDWVRVFATIRDAHDTLCPFADDPIEFAVEGPAKIISVPAVGANPVRAEAGIATVLVQSQRKSGKIRLSAQAFGLMAGEIEISCMPGK